MPRPRTLPCPPATKAAVIGLVTGTALFPLCLAFLGRGGAAIPPVAFITVGVICWGLIPRVFVEVLAPRAAHSPPADGPERR